MRGSFTRADTTLMDWIVFGVSMIQSHSTGSRHTMTIERDTLADIYTLTGSVKQSAPGSPQNSNHSLARRPCMNLMKHNFVFQGQWLIIQHDSPEPQLTN